MENVEDFWMRFFMISIIIPTFNKLTRLKLTLFSIELQSTSREYEVIIVDNGCEDGTEEYLRKLSPPYPMKYIVTKNSGRAAARNEGIKLARGELLIFVDDDVILTPNFIEEHAKSQTIPQIVHGEIRSLVQLKFFADPTIGVLYPNISAERVSVSYLKEMCITEYDIKSNFQKKIVEKGRVSTLERIIQEVLEDTDNQSDWIGFTGGNISIPKKWIEEVGGFDENFGTIWGCEDIELGYRLHEAGYPFSLNLKAVNYHMMHYRSSFRKDHQITANYFYEKHKDTKILKFQKFVEGTINRQDLIKDLLPKNK